MIKLLIMDVDGTLTDGKIYMGSDGEVMKAFDIKDGYGIHDILPRLGIIPVIITGRKSKIVEKRAWELKINELYQNIRDKNKVVDQLLLKYGISEKEMAVIGDDENDLPMIWRCGVSGCPADAHEDVKSKCAYVCKKDGGDGAVREFIDYIAEQKK